MKPTHFHFAPGVIYFSLILVTAPGFAATRYVNLNNPAPAPPYTSWATASTNIQDAIDAAAGGDEIVVTNGIYQTGGRAVSGTMTNRVAVTKPVTVRSVNGPEVTAIQGTTNGNSAVRCVYLTNGAALVGFTLTNGATQGSSDPNMGGGGGVLCAFGAVVSNCVLTGNSAYSGGGAYRGTLNNCTLTGNSARDGGGAVGATLNNCTLTGNSAGVQGGGVYVGTLNNSTLTGNSAFDGGGASVSTLNNCTLTGNSAVTTGGGAGSSSTLNNCTLTGNSARDGGGAYFARLTNCIVYYNTATLGGANYVSSDPAYTLNYSCTTPLPTRGVGNITAEPQLASTSHLSAGSPCRGAGSASYSSGVDIDGEAWANPPSIGCDEYHVGAVTSPLTVAMDVSYTNVATGFVVDFKTQISGRVSASRWEYGDGTVTSNQPYTSHHWAAAGDYAVVLWAYNETYPDGVSATVIVHVAEPPVHYVALDSSSPLAPYGSWATAARNIHDAVDSASVAGALVLVSNGVYETGGRAVSGTMTNRVAVTKPVTVQSVNGPEVTMIRGYQVPGTTNGNSAVRCVYLTNGAALIGFTLTNGATRTTSDIRQASGGGVWCESASAVVSNCVLTGNKASVSGGGAASGTLNNCTLTGNLAGTSVAGTFGGGAYFGTLNNCALTGNSTSGGGGGAHYSTLNNCTLTGNSAYSGGGADGEAGLGTLNNCTLTGNSASSQGGGAFGGTLNNCTLTGNSAGNSGGGAAGGTLNNCIVYYNSAPSSANYIVGFGFGVNYCFTTPLPPGGPGNFTNAPLFVNQAGGNVRLAMNSPCINAGRNAYAPAGLDLDGLPRIVGGTVDVGAHEYQSPLSAISYAWLQQFGLPTDGSADNLDLDGDQSTNFQEWHAGTDPSNSSSQLRLFPPVRFGPSGAHLAVTWQSVPGRGYVLERSIDLSANPRFLPLSTSVFPAFGTINTTFNHSNAASGGPWFYRVRVEE